MEASKPAPSLPSAPVWQATQGAGAGRPSWRRALLGVAYAALVLIAASRAHGQPTEAPPVRSGTVAPRVLTSMPEGDTTYPAVSSRHLMSDEEHRALLGLTIPMPPEATGIEMPPPVAPSAP